MRRGTRSEQLVQLSKILRRLYYQLRAQLGCRMEDDSSSYQQDSVRLRHEKSYKRNQAGAAKDNIATSISL